MNIGGGGTLPQIQPQRSSFGRQTVAEYNAYAGWMFPYNINTAILNTNSTDTGSVTRIGSLAKIATGTGTAATASMSTKRFLRYEPGVGARVMFTAIFTDGVASSQQEIGIGDTEDGYFIGFMGSTFGVIRRKDGTDNFISDFNIGTFPGFDPSKFNVYQITYQWLGAGEISFSVENPATGDLEPFHKIQYANGVTDVSIRNPSLPIRAAVSNSGNNTDVSIHTASATAGLDGVIDSPALTVTRAIKGTLVDAGTSLTPIMSLHNPTTYESIVNRLTIRPILLSASAIGSTGAADFEVILNPTLTGASFSDVESSVVPAQIDTSATAYSGGEIITGISLGIDSGGEIDLKNIGLRLQPGETFSIVGAGTNSPDLTAILTFVSEV